MRSAYEPLLVLAGGSNVVVADEGFPGTVVRVLTRGVERDGARLTVQAGEPWDELVADCVARGLQGFECLSGIPGSTGATPIQNVGAYGQEVSETVESVRVLDRASGQIEEMPAARVRLRATAAARSSTATATSCSRSPSCCARTTARARCATRSWPAAGRAGRRQRAAGRRPRGGARAAPRQGHGDRPRRPRLGQRGLVLHQPDPRSRRVRAPGGAPGRAAPPAFPEPDGRIKTSAAWLIERSGFPRGLRRRARGISTKHTLALVNRGGATTAELMALAREIAAGVRARFGVAIAPEPVLVGHDW